MSRKDTLAITVLTGCVACGAAVAADGDTKVGGQAFFDFGNIKQESNGNDVPPTGTGFDVKRFYFTVDHTFNDVWSAQLTTDANYLSTSTTTVTTPATTVGGPTGTTTVVTNSNSGGVTELFIKKLYLQAKLDDAFVVHVGAYTSPWAPFVEGLYGYRYIEKVATDRLGFANTADWGLNATGKFPGGVSYAASVVNGGGYKNPTRTKDVDFEGRVSVTPDPVPWLTLGGGYYNGHLGQITQANNSFPKNTATRWDVAVGVNYSGFRVGAEYFDAKNFKFGNALTGALGGPGGVVVTTTATGKLASDKATGYSGWVSYEFTSQCSVFARYDQVKPSKDIDSNLKDRFVDVGVAFKPIKQVDLALVYKNEKVDDGALSISSADAGSSYTIGGTGTTATGARTGGKFSEVGFYGQYNF